MINTAANGKPFYADDYDGPNFDNAETCRTKQDTSCVTLGIPPTSDVTNPAWGLTEEETPSRRRTSTGTSGSAGRGCTCRTTRS